jgi:hypothetical protein
LGGEEERLPVAMAINDHLALIVIKRGVVKEGQTAGLKRGSEGRASLELDGGEV